jgi:hypothetical protein
MGGLALFIKVSSRQLLLAICNEKVVKVPTSHLISSRFKEWIYFCLVIEYHPEKNDRKMYHCAWCKVSLIFYFWVIAPSPNKTNKFIPYHLIIWKHKFCVIKLICSCTISCDAWLFFDIWAFTSHIDFFGWHKITSIFQPIEKCVTWLENRQTFCRQ